MGHKAGNVERDKQASTSPALTKAWGVYFQVIMENQTRMWDGGKYEVVIPGRPI